MRFCAIREEDGAVQAAQCQLCGAEIYRGEEYYRINGESVCCACLEDYAKAVFAPFLRTGGERA